MSDALDEARDSGTVYYDRAAPIHNVLKTMNKGKVNKDEYANDLVYMREQSPSGILSGPGNFHEMLGNGKTYHENQAFQDDDYDEDEEEEDEFTHESFPVDYR